MFDPRTNQWSRKAPLPAAGPVHLAVMNGVLYALVSDHELQPSRVYEYEPSSDAWMRLRYAPSTLFGPAVVAVDGALYAVGGYSLATDRPFVRLMSSTVTSCAADAARSAQSDTAVRPSQP